MKAGWWDASLALRDLAVSNIRFHDLPKYAGVTLVFNQIFEFMNSELSKGITSFINQGFLSSRLKAHGFNESSFSVIRIYLFQTNLKFAIMPMIILSKLLMKTLTKSWAISPMTLETYQNILWQDQYFDYNYKTLANQKLSWRKDAWN